MEEVRTGVTQYNTGKGGGQDRGDSLQGGEEVTTRVTQFMGGRREEVRTRNHGHLGGNEARRHLHLAQLQTIVRSRDPEEAARGCGVAAV